MNVRRYTDADNVEITKEFEKRTIEIKKRVQKWLGSPNEWTKLLGSSKGKGSEYEKRVRLILKQLGYKIENPTSTDHDFYCDDKKVELKGSAISDNNSFTFFQIRMQQDYEYMMFLAIEPTKMTLYGITADEYKKHITQEQNWDEIIAPGGESKRGKLVEKYGKDWVYEYELFHWLLKPNKPLPKGTVILWQITC